MEHGKHTITLYIMHFDLLRDWSHLKYLYLLLKRLGGKDKNIMSPGRYDPNRPPEQRLPPMMDGPPGGIGRGQGPSPGYGGGPYGGGGRGGYHDGPPPPSGYGGYGGPPPPPRREYGGGGDRRRRRSRSRSSERGRYAPRPRY